MARMSGRNWKVGPARLLFSVPSAADAPTAHIFTRFANHMQYSRAAVFVNNVLPTWFVRIAYSYLSLIILLEVVRRYVFSASSPWGEMTARYAFVYLSYIAAAEAIRLRKHIRITLIIDRFSRQVRRYFDLYIDLLTTGLALVVIYYSLQVINFQWSVNIVMESANVN